jgi:enoyl-CoA hydratase
VLQSIANRTVGSIANAAARVESNREVPLSEQATIAAEYEFLDWEVDGPVATVWLNRPPVNAVSQDMYGELIRLFGDISQFGPGVHAIVLAARGKHFCGGNDLDEFRSMTPDNAPVRMREVREAFWAIRDCPLPVVGAVQGVAVGTGLAIAASCDFIIAAEGARLGVTEIAMGVMGAGKHLRRLVPEPVLRWMFLSGEPAPVEELLKLGAVIDVVAPDGLLDAARDRAARIARHSPLAIRVAKRSLNAIEFADLKSGYEIEQGFSGDLARFDDPKESLAAFFEGRAPKYTGS